MSKKRWKVGSNRVEIVRPDGVTVYVNTGDAGLNRLIAAAPEMAELLARLAAKLNNVRLGQITTPSADKVFREARALLARIAGAP